jgi:hypothetical protein
MNHPHELLADMVDGTLDEATLAEVRAHLDVCEGCREDLALATRGKAAARALPRVPAPTDLHDRVVTAAAGGGRGTPLWYRWAGAAAAAVAVIVLAIALPDVGGDVDRGGVRETMGAAEANGPAAEDSVAGDGIVVERLDRDFDEQDLRDLAKSSAAAFDRDRPSARPAALSSEDGAVRCVAEALPEAPTGELIRVIAARFQGREAYFAVYLEGPGADQPPDTASVYVASRASCQFLSTAFAQP